MKSEKAIRPLAVTRLAPGDPVTTFPAAGEPAARAGAALIVRQPAASAAAPASRGGGAAARLMAALLNLGDLLAGRSPVGEERVGHPRAHRTQAGAVGVHHVEVLAEPPRRALPCVLQAD